jgi:hypothetical protein
MELDIFLKKKSINNNIILTICNFGYVKYTHNLYLSCKKLGLENNLAIICLDDQAQKYFTNNNIDSFIIKSIFNTPLNFTVYKKKNWNMITASKIDITYRILKLNYNVLIIDGDIVFIKNPLDKLQEYSINYDMLIQSDNGFNEHNNDPKKKLCTGFMYLKPNKNILNLFDPEKIILSGDGCNFVKDDQKYLNTILKNSNNKVKYNVLPRNEFPNGAYWYDKSNEIKDDIKIVHFNFIIGKEKLNKMKKYKMYFLDD